MTMLYSNGLVLDTKRKILSVGGRSIDGQSIDGHPIEEQTIDDQIIDIAPLTLDVLIQLVAHAPETLSIDHIIDLCWQNKVVSDETVVQRIALIRKLLVDNNIPGKCIENRRGEGYRWLPEVSLPDVSISKVSASKAMVAETDFPAPAENIKLGPIATNNAFLIIAVCCLIMLGLSTVFIMDYDKNNNQNVQIVTPESNELLSQAHLYRLRFDKESNQHAIRLYQKVLQQEPSNVAALAGISMSYSHAVSKFGGSSELLNSAFEQASKALNIAPEDAFVLRAYGLAADVRGHITTAIKYYEHALEVNPSHISAYGDIAYLLTIKGQLSEAFNHQLLAMSGKQQFRQTQMGQLLYLLGEQKEAEHWFGQAVLLNPHNVTDRRIYLEFLVKTGRFRQVEQHFAEGSDSVNQEPSFTIVYGIALAMQNKKQEALDVFQNVESEGLKQLESLLWQSYLLDEVVNPDLQQELLLHIEQTGSVWPSTYVLLAMHSKLNGDAIQSVEYLKLAVEKGYRESRWLQMLPMLEALRETSEFMGLIEEINALVAQQKLILNNSVEYQQFISLPGKDGE